MGVKKLIGTKTGRMSKKVVRVNFRTKKIRTPESERKFDTIFKYYRGKLRLEDLEKLHGPDCFEDKELQFYINTIDPTILSFEKRVLYQKIGKHILVCDLCLIKTMKIDDE